MLENKHVQYKLSKYLLYEGNVLFKEKSNVRAEYNSNRTIF